MRKILRGLWAVAFVYILLIPGGGDKAWGAFVNIRQARNVATSWILKDSNPMKNGMGHKVREVLVYSGGIHGNPGYYVALMEPAGWMIIPADDAFEPILAFGNDLMTREAYEQSPLFRLVRVDAPRLHQRATATSRPIGGEDIPEAKRLEREDRWNYLARTAISGGRLVFLLREGGVRQDHYQKDSFADTVIPPLLDGNRWEQGTLKQYKDNGFTGKQISFYDAHTEWGGRHYLVGCTALCAGKLLHHFRFGQPDTGTVVEIQVDGQPLEATPMGGTRPDGSYRWDIMVTSPDYDVWKPLLESQNPEALAARDEIARLLYDCGVLLGSDYQWNNALDAPLETTIQGERLDPMLVGMGYRVDSFTYDRLAHFASSDFDAFGALAKTNLNFDMPFILLGEMDISALVGSQDPVWAGHSFIVDGYGYDSYKPFYGGKIAYYHAKWDLDYIKSFWDMRGLWFDLSRDTVKLLFGPLRNIILTANIAPQHHLSPLRELLGGRIWVGETPFAGVSVDIEMKDGGNASGTPQIFSSITGEKGTFVLPISPGLKAASVKLTSNTMTMKLDNADILPLIQKNVKEQELECETTIDSLDVLKGTGVRAQVGNRWWGDIVLEQALVSGVTDTMKKGVSRFNVPMPSAFPKQALNWDFRGLSAVYVSAFPYSHLAYQAWFGQFFNKLAEFVHNGGTAYIEADSWMAAAFIARRAGVNLTFYDASELPLYYGGDIRKIFPKGDLRSAVGKDWVSIPYKPYEVGSGGPLIKTLDGTRLLSTVEVTLFTGQDAYTRIYPAAVSFPYGQGMVYYTGFPVPDIPSAASAALRRNNRAPSPAGAVAEWFLSKPLANAERMSAMRSAGIPNAKIVGRSDGTVSRAKSLGVLVELPASEDVTVAAQMSRLGMKGAGSVSSDAASRRWTASLSAPDGRVHAVRTTSGDVLSFSVVSGDNVGGEWLVRLDASSGYPEGNLFVVTAALGLKHLGGTPGSGDVHPDVPVMGLRVEPESADLKVGERLSLRAILSPSNASDKRVVWSVSNPSVVSADASGNVLALTEGIALVRATAADGVHSADCTARVARPAVPPTALVLTPQSLTLKVGESAALAVSFTPPETTDRTVTWSTSDPAVATAADGHVRAVGVGTAQITAASAADALVRAVCSVTVRKKSGGGGTPEEQAWYRERYPGRNVMIAPDGDSELLGTDGADVLVGNGGDNWLEGKEGDDVYVQNLGGGHDTISNRSGGANDVDELHFGPGIIPETVRPHRKAGDLVFSLPDERGEESSSTTVEDWYRDAGARLDRIVFMDGTAWSAEDAERRAEQPPVAQKGGSGADRMKTRSGKKDTVVLYGMEGDDRLKNGKGDDVFVGGPGDDFIQSWSLLGGRSHKTFLWNRGDGHDTVDFYFFGQKTGQRRGLLRLGLGIVPGEVSLERRGSGVKVNLPGGSVTFRKARWFTGFHHPDAIVFADGTTWRWKDVAPK